MTDQHDDLKYRLWSRGFDHRKIEAHEIEAEKAGLSFPVYVRERLEMNVEAPLVDVNNDLARRRESRVTCHEAPAIDLARRVFWSPARFRTDVAELMTQLESEFRGAAELVQYHHLGFVSIPSVAGRPGRGLKIVAVFRVRTPRALPFYPADRSEVFRVLQVEDTRPALAIETEIELDGFLDRLTAEGITDVFLYRLTTRNKTNRKKLFLRKGPPSTFSESGVQSEFGEGDYFLRAMKGHGRGVRGWYRSKAFSVAPLVTVVKEKLDVERRPSLDRFVNNARSSGRVNHLDRIDGSYLSKAVSEKIEILQKGVSKHYGLTPKDLKSKSNSRRIAVPRQICMYLCRKVARVSLPAIAIAFGKHHTTVLHAINKIEAMRPQDKAVEYWIQIAEKV